ALELKEFQGTWLAAPGGSYLGVITPAEQIKQAGHTFAVSGNQFTWKTALHIDGNEDGVLQGSIRIDPNKKPKTMDLTFKLEGKTVTGLCIYELDGDTLKFCFANAARPREFKTTKENPDLRLYVWKRALGERWSRASRRQDLSEKAKAAYEQIAKLHLCAFSQMDHRGSIAILSWKKDSAEPMDILYRMGLDVLPQLAEALDDDTPSKTITDNRGRQKKVWQVNELVARLIIEIAGRDFVLTTEPKLGALCTEPKVLTLRELASQPGSETDFQKAILDWYAKFREKTPTERRIADLNDSWFRNRFDAAQWLGENKSAAGRLALVRRVDSMLDDKKLEESTLVYSELSTYASALGKIGDKAGLPQVRRVCRFLAAERRWTYGSSSFYTLFEAYHGLVLLGEKNIVRELQVLFENDGNELDEARQMEFQEHLDKARRW
ncbi:MAG TPA: TIGR03067 domain-containing protein, partial [Gemmataceae bacterium]|nr:TIGR03067 domain-containing protein [Gemmataceae bacterium]